MHHVLIENFVMTRHASTHGKQTRGNEITSSWTARDVSARKRTEPSLLRKRERIVCDFWPIRTSPWSRVGGNRPVYKRGSFHWKCAGPKSLGYPSNIPHRQQLDLALFFAVIWRMAAHKAELHFFCALRIIAYRLLLKYIQTNTDLEDYKVERKVCRMLSCRGTHLLAIRSFRRPICRRRRSTWRFS